ncbi:G-protein coupled receptor Mth2-like isoform X2 [Hermetia illucens]|uniref:G-protein coupled receptor Mth2-like isoform X2 n=1 Tax=Hermetia illucens TaxID=343691 RepID=UPI0018CC058E|nr:G-protein coupled receptor Mth2-like isoform X2 [Hermetia illucens]
MILRTHLLSIVLFVHQLSFGAGSIDQPCNYHESVNITGGKRLSDGSITFEGVNYPLKYIGTWDIKYINLTLPVDAEPHFRGCICKIKTCIRMCCEGSKAFSNDTCKEPTLPVNRYINVTYGPGNITTVEPSKAFGIIHGVVCSDGYYLSPKMYDFDKWIMQKDGRIYIEESQVYRSKDQYCLSPSEESDTTMALNPFLCFENSDTSRSIIYSVALFISVPFIILTFIVYAALPELRNLHGKTLCCYLFALALGYSTLGAIHLQEADMSPTDCFFLGSVTYYLIMASFLWLNVISFDLWWNFRVVSARGHKNERRRFIIYSVYSWGLALVFFIMVQIFQHSNMPSTMKPGFGVDGACFLNVETWMQLIYFYGQILLTISFNTTVFILTLCKIRKVNKEMNQMISRGESRSSLNREKAKIMLYLRLFIIMGVSWSLEFISWLAGQKYEPLFYITDVCNAIQGLLIFMLFVMRKRVLKLAVNKYYSMRGITRKESASMTQTSKSSVIPMNSIHCNDQENGKESKKGEDPLMSTISEGESQEHS